MELLPSLRTGRLIAVYAPHAARHEAAVLSAELALRGAVTVLDGGNRFSPYQVTQCLRRKTLEIAAAASRLYIRRAFTCYEMTALLAGTPALRQPYLILDLLNTFYDDHVPVQEACRLLEACLGHIARLQFCAPVVVTLAQPLTEGRAFLLERVFARADQIFTPEAPAVQVMQPVLF